MKREEAIQVLNMVEAHGLADEAKRIAIESLQTDIVRCKDCRYFKKIVERSDGGVCHRDLVASSWKDNGYRSRGKRREP